MAVKATKKAYFINVAYGLGAAIVLIGAMMKITHTDYGFLTANLMLKIGLITEAIIFTISAFDSPSGDYDWERAYPELMDEGAAPIVRKKTQTAELKEVEVSLSAKLDQMLKDAKLDSSLMERLRVGIEGFGKSVEDINKTADAATSTQKYGDQLALAANHMESLSALYTIQLDHGKKQVELHSKYVADLNKTAEHSEKFNNELSSLTGNLNNLNKVYGGMLTAMKS